VTFKHRRMSIKQTFTNIWQKISNIGVDNSRPFDEIKSIRLLNQTFFISSIIGGSYTVYLMLLKSPSLALLDFIIFAISIILLYFNSKGLYKVSAILYIVIGSATLAAINYAYGKVGAEFYIIVLFFTTFYIWKNYFAIVLLSFVSSTMFALALYLEEIADPIEMALVLRPYFYVVNIIASLIFIFIIYWLFLKELRRRNLEIQIKNKELEEIVKIKNLQNQHIETLLKELSHRTKNNLQIVSSMLSMEADRDLPQPAKDALKDAKNRILSINLLHQNLYKTSKSLEGFSFKNHIEDLCFYLTEMFSRKDNGVKIISQIDEIKISIDMAIPLGLIINELLINSFKHGVRTSTDKNIRLEIKNKLSNMEILVSDNGKGIENLALQNKQNFGSKLVYTLARQLRASIEFRTENTNDILVKVPIQ
jgi:two-component system, sensor histidine kinase PdtaS